MYEGEWNKDVKIEMKLEESSACQLGFFDACIGRR